MRKFQKFFYDLTEAEKRLRFIKNSVKKSIGDSTKNNRTLTVNQVLRYLAEGKVRGDKKLAKSLNTVYNVLKEEIGSVRTSGSKRTDAVDIKELIGTYRMLLMNNRNTFLRVKIGTALSRLK